MAIRANYIIDDIQRCIFELFEYLCDNTSPWTDWQVCYGYPETDVFEQFTKPFIYVEAPAQVFTRSMQAGKPIRQWEMLIGVWDDRKTGGTEEINLMCSRILELFSDPKAVNYTNTFNVTIGTTSFTGTNLTTQNIYVIGIDGPRNLFTEDIKEFRREFTVTIKA